MVCSNCGKGLQDNHRFCPKCGQAVPVQAAQAAVERAAPPIAAPAVTTAPPPPMASAPPPVQAAQPIPAPAPAQQAAPPPAVAYASIYNLKCPACGAGEYMVLGIKGSMGKSIATSLAFGAIGNLVAGSGASKNAATEPIQYKCGHCSEKFEALPFYASAEEILPVPCTVQFERVSSFVGAAVPQIMYLNGEKIGPVKNGKTVTCQTNIRYNTVFVTDQHGVAFKDVYRFEAPPQGTVLVRFNRKFLY